LVRSVVMVIISVLLFGLKVRFIIVEICICHHYALKFCKPDINQVNTTCHIIELKNLTLEVTYLVSVMQMNQHQHTNACNHSIFKLK
jgi:hypothetical protein